MRVAAQRKLDPVLQHPRAVGERDRLERSLGAEADVGQPRLIVDVDAQEHVIELALVRRSGAAEERRRLETERAQRGTEERVLLEAIPAAAAVEKSLRDRVDVEVHHAAVLDRQVVKRKRGQMRDVQLPERVRRRR